MALWDIIRDFFVKYIFGGCTSLGDSYGGYFCNFMSYDGDFYALTNDTVYIEQPLYATTDAWNGYISIGDYLSTTATIIVMVLLCILLVKLAIWIFKLGANLIRLR